MPPDTVLAEGPQGVVVVIGAAVAACIVLAGLALTVVLVVGRAVRRRVDAHVRRVRGLMENTSLRLRGLAHPGEVGETARLRSSVRRSLEHSRRVLDAGYQADTQLAQARALLARLEGFARDLDTDLAMLAREPDAGRVQRELPTLRERAQRIRRGADILRWAAQDRERYTTHDELDRLSHDIDDEATALRVVCDGAPQRDTRSGR